MTEFRRTNAAVETVEVLVADLAGAGELSDELRAKFVEAQSRLTELEPIATKMRRKCEARADFEAVREELRGRLPPGSLPFDRPDDVLRVTQELVDEGGQGAEALRPLLDRGLELEGLATYGVKMVDKVEDLLARLKSARSRFEEDIAPRFGASVATACADEASRIAAAEREAAALEADEAQRAEEEARRPLTELLAENERRLQAQRDADADAEKKRAAQEAAQLQTEAALAAEDDALRRAEEAEELRLTEVSPDVACGEALVAMLAMPVGHYREVVEALHGILAGIAAEPEDHRRRVLRTGNELFQERLARRPGTWFFLRGIGFQPMSRSSLPAGLATTLGLAAGTPSERFLVLEEPSMIDVFEEWKVWHAHIKGVADFLQRLERLAFQRTAHLGRHGLDAAAQGVVSGTEVSQLWAESVLRSG